MKTQTVELLTGAWHGDRTIGIGFPAGWEVVVVGRKERPALTADGMRARLRAPVGSPRLSELARGKRRAAIVVDDMMRPTPAAGLLPLLLEELAIAGMPRDAVTVVVACGAHHVATPAEIAKKVGEPLAGSVRVLAHDSGGDVVPLGRTAAGTPILVNRTVMEADLKIGVGGIYPHRCAGYSGGSKIVSVGVAGTETVRHLHDYFRGLQETGDGVSNEMRAEIDEIAGRIGLDFLVDAILSQRREIADLFAGDRDRVFREGVAAADAAYAVTPFPGADVVVSNAYPFDTSLEYMPRGFWPLAGAKTGATKVVIGAAPMGRGYHRLGSMGRPLGQRIVRRLRSFRPASGSHWRAGMKILRRAASRWRHDFLVWSPGLAPEDVRRTYPGATLFREWDELIALAAARHPGPSVKVAVYPCAPLQFPDSGRYGR